MTQNLPRHMNAENTRRDFIIRATSVGVALCSSPAVGNAQYSKRMFSYIGQSGVPSASGMFLGVLYSADDTTHRAEIQKIREKCSYWRKLLSRSTDKWKIKYSHQIIDYILSQDSIRYFCARIENAIWPDDPAEKDAVRLSCYAALISQSGMLRSALPVSVSLKYTEKNPHDRRLARGLQDFVSRENDQNRVIKADNELIEISQFLTGLARYEFAVMRSARRAEINRYLREKLSVRTLSVDELSQNAKFRMQTIRV
ncbi:hypothetical protein [Bosea sp. WAO]|uniref:hypothetical protein n=1 Tax=Bosea sp. WAO TaxID=406341 RepID=UPI000ABD98D9|nr:hypothetical protein [Bosea sp. WAO]